MNDILFVLISLLSFVAAIYVLVQLILREKKKYTISRCYYALANSIALFLIVLFFIITIKVPRIGSIITMNMTVIFMIVFIFTTIWRLRDAKLSPLLTILIFGFGPIVFLWLCFFKEKSVKYNRPKGNVL